MRSLRSSIAALLILVCAAVVAAQEPSPASKKIVTTQIDLPRHSYSLTVPASELVTANDVKFEALADEVRKSIADTLTEYTIADRATLRDLLGVRLNLEMLAGENERALKTIAELRADTDKADLKLTTGLVDEAILRARLDRNASRDQTALATRVAGNLASLVSALSWQTVHDVIKEEESYLEIRTTTLAVGMIKHDVDPMVAQSHTINDEGAARVIAARRQARIIEPMRAQVVAALKTYIAAHDVQKPDIWHDRDVVLNTTAHLHPVLVGIWDSGIDSSVLADHMHTDAEHAGRSPHGLAFSQDGSLSESDLRPITDAQRAFYPEALKIYQGVNDLQNQVASPEAATARTFASSTPPDELPGKVKEILFFGAYLHGTHVAGISIRDNPAAQLVVFRFDDELPEYPFAPSVAWARRMAEDFSLISRYCREHQVRVVNMSWSDTVDEFEKWLAKTSPEEDVAKRKALASDIYAVWRSAIVAAIHDAPQTLFVTAAGNSDSDTGFDQGAPSGLTMPNLITVGAVNQAGEETSFTSYGNTVVVDADGYQVDSVVPGGSHLRESGTSMAAPNVTNLAAKLFALDPSLTPEKVIALMKRGSDTNSNGRLHLINPKATVALLRATQ